MKKATKQASVQDHGQEGKADLRFSWKRKKEVNAQKRGSLYFQLGLILAMALAYAGLEASFITPWIGSDLYPDQDREILLVEEVPVFFEERSMAPLQTTAVDPSKFIIDDRSVSDDVPALIEPVSPQFPSLSLDSIQYSDPSKDEPALILMDLVDEVPVFPGCEAVGKEDRIACFNTKIREHIQRHFRYPEAAVDLGIKGRVNLSFTIDEKGRVSSLKMRGPSPILEKEAGRIISKLPVMTPGKQKGKPVRVPYSLPITFALQ